jgi:tRNA threonylcarbamoyladenosine biosynthesis protein TsaE
MDSIILRGADETRALGAQWAARCRGGEVFALRGPLGAGKTELAKGLARGLGFTGDVTSPTFSLIHEYAGGRLTLNHLDLYRIAGPEEALRFGIEDYLYPEEAITLIEWPERIAGLLPPAAEKWEIELVSETERRIFVSQPFPK